MHVGGLALVVAAFMPSWRPFAVIYAVWTLANAVTGPVFSLIVGESVPPARRGRAFGLTASAVGVSLILGPLAGAWLLPHVGAKGLLIISGILVFAAATGRLLSLRETRPESTGSKPFALRHVFEGRMGLVLLAVTLWNVVLAMTMWGPFLSLHASDAMGLSKATINVFFAVASIVSALMGLVAGRLVSRFGANKMLSIGAIGLAAAVMLWSVQRSMVGIVAGFVLMSGFMMLAMVSSDTFRVTVVEESVRGSALGAIGMVTGFATALATPVAGYLKQFSPMAPFWIGLAAAAGLVLAVVALTRHDTRTGFRGEPAHEEDVPAVREPGRGAAGRPTMTGGRHPAGQPGEDLRRVKQGNSDVHPAFLRFREAPTADRSPQIRRAPHPRRHRHSPDSPSHGPDGHPPRHLIPSLAPAGLAGKAEPPAKTGRRHHGRSEVN